MSGSVATRKIIIPDPGQPQLDFWLADAQWPGPSCFVYVLQAAGDSPIKVGKAIDVRKRMLELKTGNPRPLELKAVLVGGLVFEHELHRELKDYRLVGEWFDDPGGDAIEVFMKRIHLLAAEMMMDYRVSGAMPNFRDFSPFKERHESTLPTSLSPEQLNRVGRLSSARKRKAFPESERRSKEEFAWIMSGEPS